MERRNLLIKAADFILAPVIYSTSFQQEIGPCNIFRYRGREPDFRAKTTFLVRLNNLDGTRPDFRRRVARLEKFVSVGYREETYLWPPQSVFFEYFASGGLTRSAL